MQALRREITRPEQTRLPPAPTRLATAARRPVVPAARLLAVLVVAPSAVRAAEPQVDPVAALRAVPAAAQLAALVVAQRVDLAAALPVDPVARRLVAQAEVRPAALAEAPPPVAADTKRLTLLQRRGRLCWPRH
jgi:hypothetical protein